MRVVIRPWPLTHQVTALCKVAQKREGLTAKMTVATRKRLSFFRWFKPNHINDTLDSIDLDYGQIRNLLDLNEIDHGDPSHKGYIDNSNVIERLDERLKVTQHTTARTKSKLEATNLGKVFDLLGQASGE